MINGPTLLMLEKRLFDQDRELYYKYKLMLVTTDRKLKEYLWKNLDEQQQTTLKQLREKFNETDQ